MVKYTGSNGNTIDQKQLDRTFHALSDSTRRAILARLIEGDALVTELAEPFTMSLPAISKHLGILEQAKLIRREKEGRLRRCFLDASGMKDAAEWVEFYRQFWQGSLDRLEAYLQQQTDDNTKPPNTGR